MEKKRSLVFNIEDNEDDTTDFSLSINGYADGLKDSEAAHTAAVMMTDFATAIAYLHERIITFSAINGVDPREALKIVYEQVDSTLETMLTEED